MWQEEKMKELEKGRKLKWRIFFQRKKEIGWRLLGPLLAKIRQGPQDCIALKIHFTRSRMFS
jgi:hypothetical protein